MAIRYRSDPVQGAHRGIFGIPELYPFQKKAIDAVMAGGHVFLVVPTGSGKSLSFQVPAVVKPGTAIVFSPLLSLMKDQVDKLSAKGVKACRLGSDMEEGTVEEEVANLRKNKLVYVAPERLKSKSFRKALSTVNLSMIVLDEAHVCETWRWFRPGYALLQDFVRNHPDIPTIAVTATADSDVEESLVKTFGWRPGYSRIVSPPVRSNVEYKTVEGLTEAQVGPYLINLESKFDDFSGSRVVYCATRKSVEEVAAALRRFGLKTEAYHAGLSGEERQSIQDNFIKGDAKTIVATNAFGMGVDSPNIRIVFHFDIPATVFDYVQESGRGGRDGKPYVAVINYRKETLRSRQFLIRMSNPPIWVYEALWRRFSGVGKGIPMRATEEQLVKAIRLKDNQRWPGAALRVMEMRGGLNVTPSAELYHLPITDPAKAKKFADNHEDVCSIVGNVLNIRVSAFEKEDADIPKEAVAGGFVFSRYPETEYAIARVCDKLPLDKHHVADKLAKDQRKLEQMEQFTFDNDKQGYIERLFLS